MSKKAREMLKTKWHQSVSRLEDQNSAPVESVISEAKDRL